MYSSPAVAVRVRWVRARSETGSCCEQPPPEPTLAAGGYELVMTLDAAEHMSAESHPKLIAKLAHALAPTRSARLLFAAAPPGATGDGHIACKTPGRWRMEIELESAAHGVALCFDPERTRTARRKSDDTYLAYTLLVFRRCDKVY